MSNFQNRLHVLLSVITRQPKTCPYCGANTTRKIGSNSPLSQVRECAECDLMFRWPKQSDEYNKIFYQFRYIRLASENMHLPDPAEVVRLLETRFKDHITELGPKLDIVKSFGQGFKVCVYGANWGYEVAQLAAAGYQCHGFEVSAARASFGREQLKVDLVSDLSVIQERGPFDLIYCSHTLEHLPDPRIALAAFTQMCAPGGHLVLFVPNCGGAQAREKGVQWGPFSSSLHPLSYRADFFRKALPEHGFEVVTTASDPYPPAASETFPGSSLDGDELLVIARRSI
jgi:SAM-dependent methyltransferase